MNIKLTNKVVNKIEVGASFLLLSTYISVFTLVRPYTSGVYTQPSPIENILGDLAYIIIPLLILLRWKQFLFVITRDIFPILMCLMVIASISWSVIPNQIVSVVVGFVRTTIFSIYLATRFKRQDLINLFAWSFGIVAILSVLVALFIPGYGIYEPGSWCGIYGHKNVLGRYMARSAVIFFALAYNRNKYKVLFWSMFLVSMCLVFLSSSGGGIINFLFTMAIIPLLKMLKKTQIQKQILIFNFCIILCSSILLLIITNLEFLLGLIGKDLTLTGRTKMWASIVEYIQDRPFLGYGYSSFWDSHYGDIFRANYSWKEIPNTHNGFIEIVIGLGFIGLSIFIVGLLLTISRALYLTYSAKTLEDILPMQLLIGFLIAASSEAEMLSANSLTWIIYVAITFSLAVEFYYSKLRKKRIILNH